MDLIRREPVAVWGSVTGIAEAVIGLLLAFGAVDWTGEETGAVMLVIAAVGTMLTMFARGKVSPVD